MGLTSAVRKSSCNPDQIGLICRRRARRFGPGVKLRRICRMLRLSRLADYGVMVMAHVAADPDGAHNAADTAAATGLPGPTVAKIMARLAKGGLRASQRGARGGYRLRSGGRRA